MYKFTKNVALHHKCSKNRTITTKLSRLKHHQHQLNCSSICFCSLPIFFLMIISFCSFFLSCSISLTALEGQPERPHLPKHPQTVDLKRDMQARLRHKHEQKQTQTETFHFYYYLPPPVGAMVMVPLGRGMSLLLRRTTGS